MFPARPLRCTQQWSRALGLRPRFTELQSNVEADVHPAPPPPVATLCPPSCLPSHQCHCAHSRDAPISEERRALGRMITKGQTHPPRHRPFHCKVQMTNLTFRGFRPLDLTPIVVFPDGEMYASAENKQWNSCTRNELLVESTTAIKNEHEQTNTRKRFHV